MALSIQYTYHPMPPLGPGKIIPIKFAFHFGVNGIQYFLDPQADITTPEKEEILLSPMRIPKLKSPAMKWNQVRFSYRHQS